MSTTPRSHWSADLLAAVYEARMSHHPSIVDRRGPEHQRYGWVCGCGDGREPLSGTNWSDATTEMERHLSAVVLDAIEAQGRLLPEDARRCESYGWRRRVSGGNWSRAVPARNRKAAELAVSQSVFDGYREAEVMERFAAAGDWSPAAFRLVGAEAGPSGRPSRLRGAARRAGLM